LRQLQTGASGRLVYAGVMRGDRALEARLKRRFAHLLERPGGEWHYPSEELTRSIREEAPLPKPVPPPRPVPLPPKRVEL
jgi:hypothetical protein